MMPSSWLFAPPAKLSTAVNVRWMGLAVPGRVVNSRRQRPSSSGLVAGAWRSTSDTAAARRHGRTAGGVPQHRIIGHNYNALTMVLLPCLTTPGSPSPNKSCCWPPHLDTTVGLEDCDRLVKPGLLLRAHAALAATLHTRQNLQHRLLCTLHLWARCMVHQWSASLKTGCPAGTSRQGLVYLWPLLHPHRLAFLPTLRLHSPCGRASPGTGRWAAAWWLGPWLLLPPAPPQAAAARAGTADAKARGPCCCCC